MIEIRQIRYFLEVAAEGNITNAARRLRITQPALSRQVAAMEDRLGIRLLERVGRGIRLTTAAHALLPELRDILHRADGLSEHAAAFAGRERVRLALIAPPQSIEVFLADALGRFLKRYPDADIRIIEAAAQQNQELLERDEGQMAIAARPIGGQFNGRGLARGFIHVAVPKGHRLASKRRIGVADLDGEPVLVMRRGTLVRDMFESACRLAHTLPSIVHEAGSPHALAALCAIGIGIAVLPFTARINQKGLVVSRLYAADQPLSADLAVVWTPTLFISPAIDTFIGDLQHSMHAAPFLEPLK